MDTNPTDEHEQIQELFKRLDKNRDGRIDFDELNDYFREVNKTGANKSQTASDEQARKLFETIKTNSTDSSSITSSAQAVIENFNFRDFVDYVNRTDRKIELIFKNLDRDQNGTLSFKSLVFYIRNNGSC